MKSLLLTLCFVFIASSIFCQTPSPQNARVQLKYYTHNCVSFSSTNDAEKGDGNESEITQYKSLFPIATGYNRLTDYSTVCFIGQNKWNKTAPVVKPWQYLNGSIRGLGFRGGFSAVRGVNDNYSVLDRKLSL